MRILKFSLHIVADAFRHFLADDGWAIASHIALSTLMAMFPFLIVVTALAGLLLRLQGSRRRGREALVAGLAEGGGGADRGTISPACSPTRTAACSRFGAVFALYFASSGVESLRIGLNRAYDMSEQRPWWLLRLESIVYVLVGAVAILAFSFLVVLAPVIWDKLVHYVPTLAPFYGNLVTLARYGVAAAVLVIALLIVHLWLPAGRRSFLPRSRRASSPRCCCGW